MLPHWLRTTGALAAIAVAIGSPLAAQEETTTWAVVVGVSKFASLKPDEQLQYADKDAQAFAKFIASPRGRG
jgi:N6-adenosine-specific RNA methylase IME4